MTLLCPYGDMFRTAFPKNQGKSRGKELPVKEFNGNIANRKGMSKLGLVYSKALYSEWVQISLLTVTLM